jgi:DNA-binding transcriptional regulator GbsR (MarR family)
MTIKSIVYNDAYAPDPDWRELAVEAVGNVIEFWGFKRSQGRVWAYLYLAGEPQSAAQLQAALGMSKGSVSMIIRELEYWKVITRSRRAGDRSWRYVAKIDMRDMIARVLRERELEFIERVCEDLAEAERIAKEEGEPKEVLERLQRMRIFADGMKRAIDLFITGANLDLRQTIDVFKSAPQSLANRLMPNRRS